MSAFSEMLAEIGRSNPAPVLSQVQIDWYAAEDRERAAQVEIDLQRLTAAIQQFDTVAAYKINLSGLSARSHGRGDKQSSVYHAPCLKDFKVGRICRKPNSFLCGATSGSFGYVVQPQAELSCPRCVELARKHQLKLSDDLILKVLSNHY